LKTLDFFNFCTLCKHQHVVWTSAHVITGKVNKHCQLVTCYIWLASGSVPSFQIREGCRCVLSVSGSACPAVSFTHCVVGNVRSCAFNAEITEFDISGIAACMPSWIFSLMSEPSDWAILTGSQSDVTCYQLAVFVYLSSDDMRRCPNHVLMFTFFDDHVLMFVLDNNRLWRFRGTGSYFCNLDFLIFLHTV
jgi:hypothetical protein